MSLYRRGNIWWYRFEFQGSLIRESTGLTNKEAARGAEDKRHTALRESRAGVMKKVRVPLFSKAAEDYLNKKRTGWAQKTTIIERTNLTHLKPVFGNKLLSDIGPDEVSVYRDKRLDAGAAQKTVRLEFGTLRAILLLHNLDTTWREIRKQITLGRSKKIGRAISMLEQHCYGKAAPVVLVRCTLR
jgi:hypothetical protein